MKEVPTNLIPIPTEFHELIDREIPIVFVEMDLPIGYSISKTIQNEYHLLQSQQMTIYKENITTGGGYH